MADKPSNFFEDTHTKLPKIRLQELSELIKKGIIENGKEFKVGLRHSHPRCMTLCKIMAQNTRPMRFTGLKERALSKHLKNLTIMAKFTFPELEQTLCGINIVEYSTKGGVKFDKNMPHLRFQAGRRRTQAEVPQLQILRDNESGRQAGMNLKAEFQGVEGEVEVVGWPRPFGNCMRSNILLKGGTWISVVGREKTVLGTLAGIKKGDFVRARCKVHAGEDYRGRPRREFWVREIGTVDAMTVKISLPKGVYRKVVALGERLGVPPEDYVHLVLMEKLETAAG